MKFTLQYDGVLVSNQGSSRVDNKREIRFALDPWLRKLWEQNRQLRWLRVHEGSLARLRSASFKGNDLVVDPLTGGMDGPLIWSPFPHATIDGLTYIMLVNQLNRWICDLEIKLLVPESTHKRGDIDNRVKTLLDGLRPPQNMKEAGSTGTAPADR